MNARWRPIASAAFSAVAVYAAARYIQAIVTSVAHPARGEIREISDLVLAAGFAAAMYLWLDLRTVRHALTAAEQLQLVLDTQLALAAEVQRRLLPAVPDTGDDIRWAARLQPAGKIGGDFYDFIPAIDGSTLLLVGDVSGKGIPAALLQASAHALFRTYARQTADPAELLQLVSREVFAENGGTLYLTCLAVLVAHCNITYVNAGHPPGLLLGDSGARTLDAGGPPVGMFADTRYRSETIRVAPRDLGVIVTDGITEAVEIAGVSGIDRLTTALLGAGPALTPERVCDVLMALAAGSQGPAGVENWDDDKTVVAFEVEPERHILPVPVVSPVRAPEPAGTPAW